MKTITSILCFSGALFGMALHADSIEYSFAIKPMSQEIPQKIPAAPTKPSESPQHISLLTDLKKYFCGTIAPEKKKALEKKAFIGGAIIVGVIGTASAATAAIIFALRSKSNSQPQITGPLAELLTSIQNKTYYGNLAVIAQKSLAAGVYRNDPVYVNQTFAALKDADYLEERQLEYVMDSIAEKMTTPQGPMNLLTFATIALDKPCVQALLDGGIMPSIDSDAINTLKEGFFDANNSTYKEILELIKTKKSNFTPNSPIQQNFTRSPQKRHSLPKDTQDSP